MAKSRLEMIREAAKNVDHEERFWSHIHKAYKCVTVDGAQRHSKAALAHAGQHFIKTGKKIDATDMLDGLPSGYEHYLKY